MFFFINTKARMFRYFAKAQKALLRFILDRDIRTRSITRVAL